MAAELLREEAHEKAKLEAKTQQRRKGKATRVAAAKPSGEHLGALSCPASALQTLLGRARVTLQPDDAHMAWLMKMLHGWGRAWAGASSKGTDCIQCDSNQRCSDCRAAA